MRRIEARRKNAKAFRLRHSQSLARRRQRLSHAMVRSTIQRFGKTTNSLTPSERLTISMSRCGRTFATAFANFCPFHAPAVDDGGGRAGFPLRAFATPFIERVVDSLQCAVIGPQIEVIVDRAFRWQVLRDRAPLTASRENVHEAVHHLPHDHRPLATAGLARRDQRFDQSPFLVGQIARISQLAAVVTGAVLARPHQWPLLESGHYSSITGDSYDSSTLRTDT